MFTTKKIVVTFADGEPQKYQATDQDTLTTSYEGGFCILAWRRGSTVTKKLAFPAERIEKVEYSEE